MLINTDVSDAVFAAYDSFSDFL